jgi:hypothetical protein
MRLLLILAALLPATLLQAAAPLSQKHAVPEATPVGKPVSCLSLSLVRETKVRSDDVIDFMVSGNKVYRNTLPSKCPGLGFEERFAHKTSLSQICSVDTITVLQSPGLREGATCGLGEFQPVTLADGAH